MFTPYPYQSKAIADIQQDFRTGLKHLLVCSPTGSGKTVIFSLISKMVSERGKKVLILTDRAELLNQAGGSIKNVGLKAYFIADGIKNYNGNYSCYIAMSQTFRRRITQPYWQEFLAGINLVVIDEAHKQEFNYLFESGLVTNKHVLGFTATPKRTGGMRQLALDYEKIIYTVPIKQLIHMEKLVAADEYQFNPPDLSDVGIDYKAGDFKAGQLFQKYNTTKLYAGVVKNWLLHAPNTKTIVFCVNIEHTIKTAMEFAANGISVKYVVSDVPKPKPPTDMEPEPVPDGGSETDTENISPAEKYRLKLEAYNLYKSTFTELSGDRETIFNGHKNGDFTVLVNAGIATTGYDDPTLETGILNRATLSLQLYLQMIGRLTRASDGKTHCNILDFGGNIQRFGGYAEDRHFSLWHEKIDGNGLPPIKTCGIDSNNRPIGGGGLQVYGCQRPILASYPICPFCGFIYPKKMVEEVELKLAANTKSISAASAK